MMIPNIWKSKNHVPNHQPNQVPICSNIPPCGAFSPKRTGFHRVPKQPGEPCCGLPTLGNRHTQETSMAMNTKNESMFVGGKYPQMHK